jgi:transcriptional regulator with XRE-family HTH domain
MRAALAARDYTTVLKVYKKATGLTQEAIALLLDKDQGTVSKIYNGGRSRYTVEDVEAFRDGLRIPGHLLGLQPGPYELPVRTPYDPAATERGDPTKRRDFNRSVMLATLGITGALSDVFISDQPPAHVSGEHVRLLEQAIERLEEQDAAVGADSLYETATWLYNRAFQWLQSSSYSVEVGEALQSTVGELGAWVGWMAYDAGRHPRARHHYQETLLLARMADDHPLEVRVLSYMALQSIRQERPREALQLSRTAQRIAAGWATPRLSSLLHLRAARAYAAMANEAAFLRELARAKNQFEEGPNVDDPLFINFVTAGEVAGMTALSYIDLDKPERATGYYRAIVDNPDPVHRRNTSIYTVLLADARLRAGDVTEASEIGLGVVPVVSALDSSRTRWHLCDVRNKAAARASTIPEARAFVEAHDAAFGQP